MSTTTTTHLGLTKVDAGDTLPQASVNSNFDTIDAYVAARALTNKSGGTVAANSVVVIDTTTDSAFTTTTTAGSAKVAGVTQASSAADATAIVKQYGVTSVLVTATTLRGDWLTTSTTAGQALPTTGALPPVGAFAIALSACTGAGTVTALLLTAAGIASLTLGSTPTTTEGGMSWDATNDLLQVGTGSATKTIGLSRGAGSSATATAEMVYDTTAKLLKVWDGSASASVGIFPDFSKMLQLGGGSLTAPTGITGTGRVLLCDWLANYSFTRAADATDSTNSMAASNYGGLILYTSVGPANGATIGTMLTGSVASLILTLTGPSGVAATFGVLTGYLSGEAGNAGSTPTTAAAIAPDRSPWMRVRMNPTSGGSASITTRQFGFFGSLSATANGAYLRRNTTGNLFFVTRQGGSETAQDMGAQTNAQRWYDIYTPDAGVTWYCYDHTAATLYTSTTNVPTAGTDLIVGHYVIQSALNQTSALSRITVSYVDE